MKNLSLLTIGALISGVLMSPGLAPGAHAQSELSPTAQEAFDEIRSCLSAENATLNALFLLDASSSLRENTDPQNLRSQILAQAIDQLGAVAESRSVNWSVIKFDLGAEVMRPWEKLGVDDVDDATAWAQSQDSWWGSGQGTDWLSGLTLADEYMRDAPSSQTSCNMTIWLTDGGINVDGGRNPEVNAAAIEQICGRDPISGDVSAEPAIVNSMRSSKTHLIGVLLKSDDFLESADATTRAREESSLSFMLPITEGSGIVDNTAFAGSEGREFEFACGVNGPGQARGALLLGSSPISLAYSFADLANGIVGGSAQDLGEQFPVAFPIAPGINYVSIQLAGGEWQLIRPDGTIAAERGQESENNVRISQRGDLASVQVLGDQVQAGEWTLNVVDPLAGARLYTDIRLEGLFLSPELQAGEESQLGVEFLDFYSNEPVLRDVYDVSTFILSVQQGAEPVQELSCEVDEAQLVFTCPFVPSAVGDVLVRGYAEASTTAGASTTVWTGQYLTLILPPANFPKVSPGAIELSALDGRRGAAQGVITLVGPEEGSGSVCFPEASAIQVVSDVMDRATGYTYSGPSWGECVPLQQGETRSVELSVANGTAASGVVELAMPVRLLSDDSSNEQSQSVTISFETIRQGTPPIWLVALLIIVGLAGPIALLYAQARSAARLSLQGLQQAIVPINIGLDGTRVTVSRQSGGELFQVDDWQYLPSGSSRPRTFSSAEGVKIQAVTPRNPVGPIRARVVAPTGSRVVTSEGGTTDGASGKFGLMPAGQWFMVARDADLASDSSVIPAVLVGFANPTGGALAESGREMSLAAQDNLIVGAWETLRSSAASATPAAGDSTFPASSAATSTSRESYPENPFDSGPSGTSQTSADPAPNSPTGRPASTSPFDDITGGGSTGGETPGSTNTSNPFENL